MKYRIGGEPGSGVGVSRQSVPSVTKRGELLAQGGSGTGHPPVHKVQGQHTQAWHLGLDVPVLGLRAPLACVVGVKGGHGQMTLPSCALSAIQSCTSVPSLACGFLFVKKK